MKHFYRNGNAPLTACGLRNQDDYTYVAGETKCMNCRKVLKAQKRRQKGARSATPSGVSQLGC